MRKSFLFLIIVASGLILSSCLGDTSRHYTQPLDYVYITNEVVSLMEELYLTG